MVRAHTRVASIGRPTSAHSIVQKRDKKPAYKVQYEQVTAKRRKLHISDTHITKPPAGYTFLSVGYADLANLCKELSRDRGVEVRFVSKSNKFSDEANKISSHLHRIGYHFKSDIFDQACGRLGYRIQNGQLVRDSDAAASGFDRVMARYGAQFDQYSNRNATQEEESKVKKAIKELFPKIPDNSLHEIFQTAWKQGASTVGNASLPLSRRVQLATVAHIRHTYTDYDKLLRITTWQEARRIVEPQSLVKLVEWRGDDEENEDEVEDIIRETIIIDDDDEEIEQHVHDAINEAASESSYEIVTHAADHEDLQYQPSPMNPSNHSSAQMSHWLPERNQHDLARQRAVAQNRWQDARMRLRGGRVPVPYYEPQPQPPIEPVTQVNLPMNARGQMPRSFWKDGVEYLRLSPERDTAGPIRHATHYPPTQSYPYTGSADHHDPRAHGHGEHQFARFDSTIIHPNAYSPEYEPPERLQSVVQSVETPYNQTHTQRPQDSRYGQPVDQQYIDLISPPRRQVAHRMPSQHTYHTMAPTDQRVGQYSERNKRRRVDVDLAGDDDDYEPPKDIVDLTSPARRPDHNSRGNGGYPLPAFAPSRTSRYDRHSSSEDEYDPANPVLLTRPPSHPMPSFARQGEGHNEDPRPSWPHHLGPQYPQYHGIAHPLPPPPPHFARATPSHGPLSAVQQSLRTPFGNATPMSHFTHYPHEQRPIFGNPTPMQHFTQSPHGQQPMYDYGPR